MPTDISACFMMRLMPGCDTLSRRAAPPTVPVTIMARMTSIWRNVSIILLPQLPWKPRSFYAGVFGKAMCSNCIWKRNDKSYDKDRRHNRLAYCAGEDAGNAQRGVRRTRPRRGDDSARHGPRRHRRLRHGAAKLEKSAGLCGDGAL